MAATLEINHLDDKFGEEMDRRAERLLAASTTTMTTTTITGKSATNKSKLSSMNHHIVRKLITIMGQFCHVDLYGDHQKGTQTRRYFRARECKFKAKFMDEYSSIQKNSWWPTLWTLLLIYSSIRVHTNLYYQYSYDYHVLKSQRYYRSPTEFQITSIYKSKQSELKQQRAKNQTIYKIDTSTINREDREHFEDMLEQNLIASRRTLKHIGAPYMNAHFGFEIFIIFALLLCYDYLIYIRLYYSYIQPFEFSLIRSMLDFEAEIKICNQLIRDEVNKFIESSRVFTLNLIETVQQSMERLKYSNLHLTVDEMRKIKSIQKIGLQRLRLDHSFAVEQLRYMALDGSLIPMNKSYDWINKIIKYHGIFTICFNIYCLILQAAIATVFPMITGVPVELDPLDLLGIFDVSIIIVSVIVGSTFYGTLVFATCVDQVYIANHIRACIERCVEINERKFQSCIILSDDFQNYQDTACIKLDSTVAEILSADKRKSISRSRSSLELSRSVRMRLQSNCDLMSPELQASGRLVSMSRDDSHKMDENYSLFKVDNNIYNYVYPSQTTKQCSNRNQQQQEYLMTMNFVRNAQSRTCIELGSCFAEMNMNLLQVLLQYKIFASQLRMTKQSFGALSMTCFTLLLVMPLVGRLHMPYVDERVRYYVAMASILCALAADIFILIPITHMYSRCLNLYRAQSILIAHIVRIGLRYHHLINKVPALAPALGDKDWANYVENLLWQHSLKRPQRIYDSHAVWMLRKELNHPDHFVNQYVTVLVGVPLKYENVLRAHFWVGIVIISLFIDSSTYERHRDLLSVLFVDPLRMFQ